MKKLENKVAVVTGSSKGIGASIALHLAAEGASVVVNYATRKEGADKVVNEIVTKGGKAVAIQGDFSVQADIDRVFAETKTAFGKLDILVNNAGFFAPSPLEAITEEHFYYHFNLNVLGLLLSSQKAAEHFGENGGNIINISSVIAQYPVPGYSVYAATKAAVIALTRALAKELGPRKIRINAIAPGLTITERAHDMGFVGSDLYKSMVAQVPLGRAGAPDDIAKVAVFLASDDSGWLTGENLLVSGGANL